MKGRAVPVHITTRLLFCVLLMSAAYWWWKPPLYCSELHAAMLTGLAGIGLLLGEIWHEVRRR